ncbi:MAG: chitinase [Thermotogae bacterium]|nr:chitinase [Thermotogota bacterium]
MKVKLLITVFMLIAGITLLAAGIAKWESGGMYSTGDLVKYDGKIYRCLRVHKAVAGTEPAIAGEFWKPVKDKIIGAYYPSWGIYARNFNVMDIDGSKLTHLFYAFANISDDGLCVLADPWADVDKPFPGDSDAPGTLRGNFNQLRKLKEKHPHLKVLISVGGWTLSKNFPKVAATEESRKRFVKSCIDLFIKGEFGEKYGTHPGIFDGIDVDWEYPVEGGMHPGTPEDKRNFTLLIAEFRKQLDELSKQTGKQYLLTIAGAAKPDYIFKNTEIAEVAKYLDFIVVMTYDFHGAWDPTTNFHCNLYYDPADTSPGAEDLNVEAVIRNYIKAGVSPEKLVLGIPFYGRSWKGVENVDNGLYQKADGAGPGTWEPGVLDYRDIVKNYEPKFKKFFHPKTQSPWLFDGDVFITYDDPDSVTLKAKYVLEHDLAGVAIWEISADIRGVPAPEDSLINTIYEVLKGE